MCGNLSCYKEKYLVIGLEGFDEWFSRQPGSWDGRWWQMVFYSFEILPPFLDLPPLQKQGIMKFGESDHCLYYLKMWRYHLKAAEKKFKGDCDRSRKHNRAVMPPLVCLAKPDRRTNLKLERQWRINIVGDHCPCPCPVDGPPMIACEALGDSACSANTSTTRILYWFQYQK